MVGEGVGYREGARDWGLRGGNPPYGPTFA